MTLSRFFWPNLARGTRSTTLLELILLTITITGA